ncbi:MAG: chemotaxis protein [Clostridiales bacterium]|jgi:two-component system chemotaxis response regulator CheV|nr:chemotaxis protein [Clostridiales bacterium]
MTANKPNQPKNAKNEKQEILLESGTNELEVIEFTVAHKHFGINVSKVVEILKYTPVTPMPNSNPFVEGIFKPRDEVMTLINLAAYLGLPPDSGNLERDIYVITHFNGVSTAFHVHDVAAIHRISWTSIEKPDPTIYGGVDSLATGIAHINGQLITIIDFEKILGDINPNSAIDLSVIKSLGERPRNNRPLLVAEDSVLLEKMILQALEDSGFSNVTICSNGSEAWEILNNYKTREGDITDYVACVITDIEMPQMDGHRLLKLIRDDAVLKNLPVIVFSSLISDEMRLKGESLGATAQLSKPEIARLVALIDKYAAMR